MTTRILKTQQTRRLPLITLHCPSCRSPQRCRPVGHANLSGQRREVLMCTAKDCELIWIPGRTAVPAAA